MKGLYVLGFFFLGISGLLGIALGSTPLSFSEIVDAFSEGFNSSAGSRIFAYSRLPRTLASMICGAALSVSGAVIQGVLANRLASPSIIGVNAGAGLAVIVAAEGIPGHGGLGDGGHGGVIRRRHGSGACRGGVRACGGVRRSVALAV